MVLTIPRVYMGIHQLCSRSCLWQVCKELAQYIYMNGVDSTIQSDYSERHKPLNVQMRVPHTPAQ